MPDASVFDALAAPPRVRDFFGQAVREGRLGQAYLLVGPSGAGQEETARAVTQAVVCHHGGCGTCDDCRRAAEGLHPDVRWERPGSAKGYLVDQVRALNDEVALAPVGGAGKAIVLERADRLGSSAANALLKTVEEPPARVTFLLTAPSVDAVLPTIASRCQVVPFSAPSRDTVVRSLMEDTGATEGRAVWALAVCEDTAAARSFLSEEGTARREACDAMADAVVRLRPLSSWGVVRAARDVAGLLGPSEAAPAPIVARVAELVDAARVAKAVKPGRAKALKNVWEKAAAGEGADPVSCEELAGLVRDAAGAGRFSEEDEAAALDVLAAASRAGAEADYLSAGAAKERALAATRQQKAQERSSIMESVACAEALLRDLLALVTGAEGALVCGDHGDALRPVAAELAQGGDAPAALLVALDACGRARAQIRANVNPRVALEALLLSVKEALWLSSSR